MHKHQPTSADDGSARLDVFVGVMVFSLIAAFIGSWVTTNYFGASTSALLSFAQADYWCSVANPGLGIHCFGDYGYSILLPLQDPYANWQIAPHSYPPLANSFFLPFRALAANGQPGIALALYEITLAACLLAPMTHLIATLRPRLTGAAIAIAIAGPLTTPFLIALDRGNNVCILVPLIYCTYRAVARERYVIAAFLVVAMVNWRPQMILFAIVFIGLRRYRQFVFVVILAPITLVASFVMFGASSPSVFQNWWTSISQYQNMTAFPSTYPYNLSLASTISLVSERLHHLVSPTSAYLTNWEDHTTIIGVCAVLISCFAVWIAGCDRRSKKQVLLMATLLPVLATATSFSYYLVVALVPLAFVAADWLIQSGSTTSRNGQVMVTALSLARCSNRYQHACWYSFAALSIVVIVPWPVTIVILPKPDMLGGSLSLILAGPLLAITWAASTLAAVRSKYDKCL